MPNNLSLVNKLRNARVDPIVIFSEYIKRINDVHVFIEGKDDTSFYPHYIRSLCGKNALIHNCGNKSGVIITCDYINSKRPGNKGCYFIDKDYENYLTHRSARALNVYTTKYYSIENYIAEKNTIENCIVDYYGFERGSQKYENCLTYVLILFGSFCEVIKPITAYVICEREEKNKAKLAEINLSKLFKIDATSSKFVDLPQKRLHLKDVYNKFSYFPKYSEYKRVKLMLINDIALDWLRGKWVAWALLKIFRQFEMNNKVRSIIPDSLTVSLVPRCSLPNCLRQYINEKVG